MPYILTDPESTSDSQPKNTRFLRIPKHFPEYVAEGGWSAPFLGASVAGKLGFGESTGKFYTTKVDYNHHVRPLFVAVAPCSLLAQTGRRLTDLGSPARHSAGPGLLHGRARPGGLDGDPMALLSCPVGVRACSESFEVQAVRLMASV